MPNHVTHRVKLLGPRKDLEQFAKEMIVKDPEGAKDEEFLDFEKLIPTPPELLDESKRADTVAYEAWYGKNWRPFLEWPWVEEAGVKTKKQLQALLLKREPDAKKKADQTKRNLEKYGYPDWYYWRIANWGTKWNSYSFRWGEVRPDPKKWTPRTAEGALEFYFDTAWSPPEPIFEMLAKRYPSLLFTIASFDEQWNFACKGGYHGDTIPTYQCGDATSELHEYVYGYPPPGPEE